MNTRILNRIYICLALGALFGAFFLRSVHPDRPHILADTKVIPVTVADTQALREQGLSGTSSLEKGTGKLFVFDTADAYGFWMKDMHYPLDIVWIDATWTVIGVAHDVTVESYPAIVYPPAPVQYVLEVNAHEAVVDNLTVGTKLHFEK